jgi:hypothetical protein
VERSDHRDAGNSARNRGISGKAFSGLAICASVLVMLYSCSVGSACLPFDTMEQLAMLDIYQLGMIRVKA